MFRLKDFDYKSPYFYMVTIKRMDGLLPLSEIGPKGLVENELTRAFNAIIQSFHLKWRCLEEISPFIVMPDHIHLLIKIKPVDGRQSLGRYIYQLEKALAIAYWKIVGADETAPSKTQLSTTIKSATSSDLLASTSSDPEGSASGGSVRPIFDKSWHDWIVKREGQLAAFRRYIKENPTRAWERRANARFFQRVAAVEFLERRWFGYGNPEILRLPMIVALKGHRATKEGSPDWNAAIEAASRIGPGGAGVSTFMSPLEKACGNAIAKAGGKLIVLSPEGFSSRWHPTRNKERFCTKGNMLFLSLYEATARQPTRQELYHRCHEMIDLAIEKLPHVER